MRNVPHGFDIYLVNIKTMRKIFQFFFGLLRKAKLYQSLKGQARPKEQTSLKGKVVEELGTV